MVYFAYGLAWLSTAIVASVSVYVTKSLMPLWLMILPASLSIKSRKE